MSLDPLLIEVLACPTDKGPLLYFEDEELLYNPRLQRAYEIHDGVPVLLVDEARTVDAAEHQRLTKKAEGGAAVETGHGAETPSTGS
ncbi:MAG TPA: Trm112 family protein [Acidimicrobiales bacterium]|nr:Trm112 family protein [Acidimicrobiales bacterium]